MRKQQKRRALVGVSVWLGRKTVLALSRVACRERRSLSAQASAILRSAAEALGEADGGRHE